MIVKRWTWRMGLVVLGFVLGVAPAGAETMVKDDIAMQSEIQAPVIYLDDAVLATALGESSNEVDIAPDSVSRWDVYNDIFNQTMNDLSKTVFVKEISADVARAISPQVAGPVHSISLDEPIFKPAPVQLVSGSEESVASIIMASPIPPQPPTPD